MDPIESIMNILQVTAFYSPVMGGSAEIPYQISGELAKRGHQVTVYTSDYKMSRDYLDSLPDVDVHSFRTVSSAANFFITPGMAGSLKREITRFDVVHLHNYRTYQNIIASNYARKFNVPYILHAHGSLPRINSKQGLKRLYDGLWGHRILKSAFRAVAISPFEAEQYRSTGVSADRISVIPNGIEMPEAGSLPEKGQFRDKFGLSVRQKIILFLGRIHQLKGLDILTGAYTSISSSYANTRLVIAGPDDGYLPVLKKIAADLNITDRILFTGPLYGMEKLAAYIDADIFVLPSVYEIFGITAAEALACGTPVVVTDRCGIADAVGNSQAGIVVPHDERQLQDALIRMLDDDKIRLKYAENGISLVHREFSREQMVGKIEDIYKALPSAMY